MCSDVWLDLLALGPSVLGGYSCGCGGVGKVKVKGLEGGEQREGER